MIRFLRVTTNATRCTWSTWVNRATSRSESLGIGGEEPEVLRLVRDPAVELDQQVAVLVPDRPDVGGPAVAEQDVGLPVPRGGDARATSCGSGLRHRPRNRTQDVRRRTAASAAMSAGPMPQQPPTQPRPGIEPAGDQVEVERVAVRPGLGVGVPAAAAVRVGDRGQAGRRRPRPRTAPSTSAWSEQFTPAATSERQPSRTAYAAVSGWPARVRRAADRVAEPGRHAELVEQGDQDLGLVGVGDRLDGEQVGAGRGEQLEPRAVEVAQPRRRARRSGRCTPSRRRGTRRTGPTDAATSSPGRSSGELVAHVAGDASRCG